MTAMPIRTIMMPMTNTLSSSVKPCSIRFVFLMGNFQFLKQLTPNDLSGGLRGALTAFEPWDHLGPKPDCRVRGTGYTYSADTRSYPLELTPSSAAEQLDSGTGSEQPWDTRPWVPVGQLRREDNQRKDSAPSSPRWIGSNSLHECQMGP